MGFVSGETARERVQRKGPLDVAEALTIVTRAAEGMAFAHKTGVIHRDIKPENLLVSTNGEVKVADLGLAKVVDSSTRTTETLVVAGTPACMSPEQWRGRVSSRVDVYALGATLYFLLTGRDPYRAKTQAELMLMGRPFPDARRIKKDVPSQVVAFIFRCTAKNPAERFLDAVELSTALTNLNRKTVDLSDRDAALLEREREQVDLTPTGETLSRITLSLKRRPRAASASRVRQGFGKKSPGVKAVKRRPLPRWRRPVGVTSLVASALLIVGVIVYVASPPRTEVVQSRNDEPADLSVPAAAPVPASAKSSATFDGTSLEGYEEVATRVLDDNKARYYGLNTFRSNATGKSEKKAVELWHATRRDAGALWQKRQTSGSFEHCVHQLECAMYRDRFMAIR